MNTHKAVHVLFGIMLLLGFSSIPWAAPYDETSKEQWKEQLRKETKSSQGEVSVPETPQGGMMPQDDYATEESFSQPVVKHETLLDEQSIRDLQYILKDEGFYSASIDGIVGPKTKAALINFQRKKNIERTGKLDDQTVQHLGLALPGSAGNPNNNVRCVPESKSKTPG